MVKDLEVLQPYQSTVRDPDTDEVKDLDYNFFRFMINVFKNSYNNDDAQKHIGELGWYDANPPSFKNTVKVYGKQKNDKVTYENIGDILSYKSCWYGTISFKTMVISKKGISLKFYANDVNVAKIQKKETNTNIHTKEEHEKSMEMLDAFELTN